MSLRAERIINLSKRLRSDRDEKLERGKVLREAKEEARFKKELERERINDEKCARFLKETGVVEIFEELQKHFPGSEVLFGCDGSRVAFVRFPRSVDGGTTQSRSYGIVSKYLYYDCVVVRIVNNENIKKHMEDGEKDVNFDFVPKAVWGKTKTGVYIGNERVEDLRVLDDLIANKIAFPDILRKHLRDI